MSQIQHNLKYTKQASFISLMTYVIIAILKIGSGLLFNSSALQADGFNNLTDTFSTIAIFIGIHIAYRPADNEHQYGHWKAESTASLISSFIMFYIGIEVLLSAINSLLLKKVTALHYEILLISLLSGFLFIILYLYNHKVALQTNSIGLKATAKNNLIDAIISILTAFSIYIANIFQMPWIDSVIAIIISFLILKMGWSIFKETVFQLSDGFDKKMLQQYRDIILSHEEIYDIRTLKARHYGPNIYVDVTILVHGNLSVYDSHAVTEEIEMELKKCGVYITDVHVEPH